MFGYKLVKQTEMIPLEKMTFYQVQLPPYNPEDNEPKGCLEKLPAWLLPRLGVLVVLDPTT